MSDLSVANVEELQKELKTYKKCEKKLRKGLREKGRSEYKGDLIDFCEDLVAGVKTTTSRLEEVRDECDEMRQELYDSKCCTNRLRKKLMVTEIVNTVLLVAGGFAAFYYFPSKTA